MKKGGGKQKGSFFEREICKKLSLSISNGERDDLFWRSAMSGGRASIKFKKGIPNLTQVGDITAIDPLGHKLTDKYVIECKNYKNIHIESLIYGFPKKNSVLEFWNHLVEQSDKVSKKPLLIFKENRKLPQVLLVDYQDFIDYNIYYVQVSNLAQKGYKVYLLDFKDFLEFLPKKIMDTAEEVVNKLKEGK